MGYNAFNDELDTTGEYHSVCPPVRRLADRLFSWCDVWYHYRVAEVIFHGSLVARRGAYDSAMWGLQSYGVLRAAEVCDAAIHITGHRNLSALPGASVIVANHMSFLETMLLPAQVLAWHPLSFVVKRDLLTYPVFGAIMRSVEPIAVSRTNPREDLKTVLTEGQEHLERGKTIVIFPQSTRTATFDVAAFNSLGVKLARRAKVPVVPLALKTDFLLNGRWIKDFGRLERSKPVYFEYGEPLEADGGERAVQERVVQFIAGRLEQWGGTVMWP